MSYSTNIQTDITFDDENCDKNEGYTLNQPKGKLGKLRWLCGYTVNHPLIQRLILGCIIVNCIIVGIDATDLVYNSPDSARKRTLDSVNFVILMIFTVESGLQLIYHWLRLFKDPWLSFDFVLVVSSWLTEILAPFKNLNMRGFRVLRALRLFQVGPIRELLSILTKVIPKLAMIIFLITVLLYIFAVLFTNLFKEVNSEEDYFSRLDTTLFTLLQMMTMDYVGPMRAMMEVHSWAWIPFILFIVVMGFLMFNLVVAVVCDAVGSIGNKENEAADRERARHEARYKVYCASKMMSDVIIIQQQKIEEQLYEATKLLLKNENFQDEDIEKFRDVIVYRSMKKPVPEYKHTVEASEEEFDDNPIDKKIVPSKYLVKERILCGKLVNHHVIQNFILICIVLNCVLMGIGATDLKHNAEVVHKLDIIDRTFLIIFTIESAMNVFYLGYRVFQDAWTFFDLLIVIFSWALEGLAVVRGFRVIRALRVTVRVGPMKEILIGIFDSVERISAVILLSVLLIYIFAILFTQLYMDLELSEDYYTRLDFTVFTLLQIMTLDFASPMRETLKFYPNSWITHVAFVVLSGLLFFNLMAGVVCDTIQNSDKEEESKKREEISKLSFQLRCVGFQVSILTNSNQCVQEQIAKLSNKVQTQKKKLRDASNDTSKEKSQSRPKTAKFFKTSRKKKKLINYNIK